MLRHPCSQYLKIKEKVSFNIASQASYIYIVSGEKFIKNGGFEKTEAFGQIVLPDRSILKGRKVLLFSLLEFVYLLKTAQQSKKRIIEVHYSKREHYYNFRHWTLFVFFDDNTFYLGHRTREALDSMPIIVKSGADAPMIGIIIVLPANRVDSTKQIFQRQK